MPAISPSEPLLTQHQAAEYIAKTLVVSERHVYDRWVHFPDFPKPRLLPSVGKTARKRFVKSEIEQWIESQKGICDTK